MLEPEVPEETLLVFEVSLVAEVALELHAIVHVVVVADDGVNIDQLLAYPTLMLSGLLLPRTLNQNPGRADMVHLPAYSAPAKRGNKKVYHLWTVSAQSLV